MILINIFRLSIRHGIDIGSLKVYLRSISTNNFTSESVIWALDGQQGKDWRHGFVPVQSNERYQIIIEGVRGKSFEGDIAIDDIGVLPKDTCVIQPIEADPIRIYQEKIACHFEKDFCQWQFDPTGKFNWTRHTETTPSTDTGPNSGIERIRKVEIIIHSFVIGADNTPYYIFIESSYPQYEGDRAGLISPILPSTKRPMCFEFYYHM